MSRKLVSVSALSTSDSNPPMAVVEFIDADGEYVVETYATDDEAWKRFNALMSKMNMRRI